MKIAYVVPRYGVEVLGGAELGARMLAERLVSMRGWEVEVLTTCAQDARTWADAYAPGRCQVNGVSVRRFGSRAGRSPRFEAFSRRVLSTPDAASPADQQRWIELQGPLCPDLVAAAADSDADLVVFYPYLYYPTVRGVPVVGGRAVMHPAAHDEPPLRLGLFRDVFAATRALVFQTRAERALVQARFAIGHRPQLLMGLGIQPSEGSADSARQVLGLEDDPYLVCLGRVDPGKGTNLLARLFAAFKDRHPGPLKLVYVGPVVRPVPEHPDILLAGAVDEPMKWGTLRGATALVSPAPLEAFSLAVMEGWSAGLPVLVNAVCKPTVEHVQRSGGGFCFGSYGYFEVALERLLSSPVLRATLGRRGRAYVVENYSWPVLIDMYSRFLTNVADRCQE